MNRDRDNQSELTNDQRLEALIDMYTQTKFSTELAVGFHQYSKPDSDETAQWRVAKRDLYLTARQIVNQTFRTAYQLNAEQETGLEPYSLYFKIAPVLNEALEGALDVPYQRSETETITQATIRRDRVKLERMQAIGSIEIPLGETNQIIYLNTQALEGRADEAKVIELKGRYAA